MLLELINNLQIIVHIPMMNVVIPANVLTFFAVLIPLVMFDVLEDFKVLNAMFPDSESDADINMKKYS